MKICILLNGDINNYSKTCDIIMKQKYDYIICCDGGANHAYAMDLEPDYIIGDLDSIKKDVLNYYKEKNVEFKQFPTKKDETDMELAIHMSKALKANLIDFIGALGGRIDHTIANINILSHVSDLNIRGRIISEVEEVYLIKNEKISITGHIGDLISVIPINGDAKNVTLKGLEYPLDNFTMKYGKPLGISNVMNLNKCSIEVSQGSLLIVHNK